MNHEMRHFFETAKKLSLTERERGEMRAALGARMRGVAKPAAPVPSPYFRWEFFLRYSAQVVLPLLIIVISGGSIVQAAERALPGDLLYPLKTRITEPVTRLLYRTSPELTVHLETRILEKRLVEAEQLDRDDSLGVAERTAIKQDIISQTIRAGIATHEVEEERADEKSERNMHPDINRPLRGAKSLPLREEMDAAGDLSFSQSLLLVLDPAPNATTTPHRAVTATERVASDTVIRTEPPSEEPTVSRVIERHRNILEKLDEKQHSEEDGIKKTELISK